MPSFDVISKVNQQELANAIANCNREISTRFDFKGLNIVIEANPKENNITAMPQSITLGRSSLIPRGATLSILTRICRLKILSMQRDWDIAIYNWSNVTQPSAWGPPKDGIPHCRLRGLWPEQPGDQSVKRG